MFLQCIDDTANNDSEKVAFIPFEAIDYIVHAGTTVAITDRPDRDTNARTLTE